MKYQALIIGYKNHARRVIDAVLECNVYKKVYVYHPEKSKLSAISKLSSVIEITDNLSNGLECCCFFICSPSDTHVNYIKLIFNLFKGISKQYHIYCEKPLAVSKEEISWLKSQSKYLSGKLYVGFNQSHSGFALLINKYLDSKKLGGPISANFETTHGLAFKVEAANNWRFVDRNTFSKLLGNLAIHYIHLSLMLFGDVEDFYFSENNSTKKINSDTIIVVLRHKNGVISSIFHSYATICSRRFNVFFADGAISQGSDFKITIRTPRDEFDEAGQFVAPQEKFVSQAIAGRDETLLMAIKCFNTKALCGEKFCKKDFELAIKASELVLLIEKRFLVH